MVGLWCLLTSFCWQYLLIELTIVCVISVCGYRHWSATRQKTSRNWMILKDSPTKEFGNLPL